MVKNRHLVVWTAEPLYLYILPNLPKKNRSAKTSKSEKNGLPPLPRYAGTCTIMYEKILATIRKSGLYDLTRMAYSTPCRIFFSRQNVSRSALGGGALPRGILFSYIGVDYMQHRSNRIIRFCGWWL